MTLDDFYKRAGVAITMLDSALTVQLQRLLQADHIAYKCADRAEFEEIRGLFEHEGASFWNAQVSGRSIAYIFLPKPLQTIIGEIRYLELSDQKPDGSQGSGFDHIEVYPSDSACSQDWIVARLNEINISEIRFTNRPHHPTWDLTISEGGLELRLEKEPLIRTIVEREMRAC